MNEADLLRELSEARECIKRARLAILPSKVMAELALAQTKLTQAIKKADR